MSSDSYLLSRHLCDVEACDARIEAWEEEHGQNIFDAIAMGDYVDGMSEEKCIEAFGEEWESKVDEILEIALDARRCLDGN